MIKIVHAVNLRLLRDHWKLIFFILEILMITYSLYTKYVPYNEMTKEILQ